ncbi:MAG: class D beta-lactamase [Bacteroidetes bacterium]|nr:class D beta-lactamase [Bacteroidota bacterium]
MIKRNSHLIYLFTILIAAFFYSCTTKNETNLKENKSEVSKDGSKEEYRTDFQMIIDSAGLTGGVLIYDPQSDVYYSNDFERSTTGYLPASTFKIPNSIIALETGVAKDDSTMYKWDGKKRSLPQWEQDLILKDAFSLSCVPCYQQIAREIGVDRMKEYLNKFDYGDITVDSSNIDKFWLEGDSKISQMQQIDFLKKFYTSGLPVSARTSEIMKRIMLIEESDSYKLSGKTGWAKSRNKNLGWFVGYVETEGKVFYFATNIESKKGFNMDNFAKIRPQITIEAFRKLGLIK